jgi:hypothetical protein
MKALENFIHQIVKNTIEFEEKNGVQSDPFPEGITFWQEGRLHISAECEYSTACVADYYGEFRGGYSWINEDIEKKAEELGLHIEWLNPGCLAVYEA